ncbi:MAG: FAD-dependent oxidoreductase [Tetrasphaera sp.]
MTATPHLPPALAEAVARPVWWGEQDPEPVSEPLTGRTAADLVVVGAGLTGLWTAIEATIEHPGLRVLLLEGGVVGSGASGRNGGFVSDSLTHGLTHGAATEPRDLTTLLRLGRENLRQIADFVAAEGIDADLRMCGKTVVATRAHEVPHLRAAYELYQRWGEDAELLDREALAQDVRSPTYLAGLRIRSGGGLVDPYRLLRGLLASAQDRGAVLHERTPVEGLSREKGGPVLVRTRAGTIRAGRVVLATNAYPPLLRRIRARVLPVWDHVVATAPLTDDQLQAIGWPDRQGITDSGNQFHYYRLTPDDRLLFGGYDAIYYYGNDTHPSREQRNASHAMLVRNLRKTFPALTEHPITHRWAGLVDTTSRFTAYFGTSHGGRVAFAVGYTGLGVAASRFGAQVALDLVQGRTTERTQLHMVRQAPLPFPAEPARWLAVQATRGALAREDASGRRGPLLRALDRFGVGFNN